jgi:hypothetical protein
MYFSLSLPWLLFIAHHLSTYCKSIKVDYLFIPLTALQNGVTVGLGRQVNAPYRGGNGHLENSFWEEIVERRSSQGEQRQSPGNP